MDHEPSPMTVWQRILVTITAICSVNCSLVLSWYLTTLARGENYADIGVSMYRYRTIALLAGLFSFPALSYMLLYAIKQTLSKNSNLPYKVGIPTFALYFLFYLILLIWVYG
ncbi:hypothetical protein Cylst_4132 [Cylindrospermum stagnale PCC 7417]|uniref:Uncharacterized protein n=1 Tax=Cylindrospermum stagnale PCC 7417 TaxID=56107 RepID=K9X3F6_9NOST|nr:hypothetical protein Cylst_4132 [Cylindrospermum stagnale PCC 7417]